MTGEGNFGGLPPTFQGFGILGALGALGLVEAALGFVEELKALPTIVEYPGQFMMKISLTKHTRAIIVVGVRVRLSVFILIRDRLSIISMVLCGLMEIPDDMPRHGPSPTPVQSNVMDEDKYTENSAEIPNISALGTLMCLI